MHQADPESSHQSPDTLECIDLTEDEVATAHARDLPRPRHGSAASVADTLSIKTEFEDPDTEGRSRRRRSEEAGLGGMGQYSSQKISYWGRGGVRKSVEISTFLGLLIPLFISKTMRH